ncbi:MAG: anaerobic ribonucleoside-triphosphate reductase activating protein [Lachnospiraceae bacterium]|nr:anaerobic ribonucleoside-triphosphate reductase activating protein [Lachnospiraceae bacterium]
MKIHGINGLSLLDYPGKMACTIFTGHCNFRCPFCHNATLVLNPDSQPVKSEEEVFNLLRNRSGRLEGVAITGGEPTLNRDLPDFCRKIKEMGLSVKLDTNGSLPNVVRDLTEAGLVDYIAMDIKASPENYANAVGLSSFDMGNIFESVDLIMANGAKGKIDYEFRTTVVQGLHTETDFIQIGKWLKGAKGYFLQGYRSSDDQLNPEGLSAVPVEIMEHYREILLPNIPNTQLRGVV